METQSTPDPAAARAALADVAAATGRVGSRAGSTPWYRIGLGLVMAAAFVLFGFGDVIGFAWTAVLVLLAPFVLTWALARATGVSVDRYGAVPATRRDNVRYQVGMFGLLIPGAVLALGLDVPWAMAPFALAVFGLVQVMERRLDAALRRGMAG